MDLAVGESSGDVVGVGNVPTPHSASSPVPGPFDDLIEPVKKVQFEIGEWSDNWCFLDKCAAAAVI